MLLSVPIEIGRSRRNTKTTTQAARTCPPAAVLVVVRIFALLAHYYGCAHCCGLWTGARTMKNSSAHSFFFSIVSSALSSHKQAALLPPPRCWGYVLCAWESDGLRPARCLAGSSAPCWLAARACVLLLPSCSHFPILCFFHRALQLVRRMIARALPPAGGSSAVGCGAPAGQAAVGSA